MGRLATALALLLLAALVLAPIASMVLESFRIDTVTTTTGEVLEGQIKNRADDGVTIRVHGEDTSRFVASAEVKRTGRAFTLRHYERVLAGPGERNMLLATLALAGASTLLAFLIGFPLGILFGATDLPLRRTLETLTVLPLVLPPILLAIATYRDLLFLRPEFLRAVVVFGLSLFPLVSLFTARAVRATGADALEAARVQAPPREALLRVVVGPALPGATAGALLVFVFVVSDFAVPDFLGVTTAKNTITVYANAVFRYWNNDANAGAATAAGMPATLLALIAFALVLCVEARRTATTLGSGFREAMPLPLRRARGPLLAAVLLLVALALVWPAWRHLETAAGAHFGEPVASGGAAGAVQVDAARAKPTSLWDGLRKGVRHDGVGESVRNSLTLAGGGALLAVLLAVLLTEAGRGRPRLDRFLLVASFLPVAVPAMLLAVGWVRLFGPQAASGRYFPILLLGVRLLPFAAFAVRAARRRIAGELLDAGAVAGLGPIARTTRITLPLLAPGAALGLLLAFLFGLREVDAIVFTRSGSQTLPVQLYNMIHYGFDVQVGALSFLWTAGVALFLAILALLLGGRFRLTPR